VFVCILLHSTCNLHHYPYTILYLPFVNRLFQWWPLWSCQMLRNNAWSQTGYFVIRNGRSVSTVDYIRFNVYTDVLKEILSNNREINEWSSKTIYGWIVARTVIHCYSRSVTDIIHLNLLVINVDLTFVS